MEKVSPFLQKKFFEYVLETVRKKDVVDCEYINIRIENLISLAEIIKRHHEGGFIVPKLQGMPLVLLAFANDYVDLLCDVFIKKDMLELFFHDGGGTISVDPSEKSVGNDLRISSWGSFNKIIKEFELLSWPDLRKRADL